MAIEVIGLFALVGLMSVDYLTGTLSAYVTQALCSKIATRGVARKAIILLIVTAGAILEPLIDHLRPGIAGPVLFTVILWFCGVELVSIMENAAKAGVVSPPAFRVIAVALQARNSERGDSDDDGKKSGA